MRRIRLLLLGLLAFPLLAAPEYPKMGADIYDTKADGTKQIAAALKQAEAGHKHVLVMFGANWCIWCHKLHTLFEKDAAVAKVLAERFEVVLIDINTRSVSGQLSNNVTRPTVIGVTDGDGRGFEFSGAATLSLTKNLSATLGYAGDVRSHDKLASRVMLSLQTGF